MEPWRREQEPPVGRECVQSTRTQTKLLIPSLSGKKILLHPHGERKSKKGIRIQTKINKTSILGRWLKPIFSHTLKFILWQKKALHTKSGLWLRKVKCREKVWMKRPQRAGTFSSPEMLCVDETWLRNFFPIRWISLSSCHRLWQNKADQTLCLSPFVDGYLFSLPLLLFCSLGSELWLLLQTS